MENPTPNIGGPSLPEGEIADNFVGSMQYTLTAEEVKVSQVYFQTTERTFKKLH